MAAPRSPTSATFADLAALGDDARAEIIHGAIIDRAAPTAEHSHAQMRMSAALGNRYDRRPGGRWPGGWWILIEVDTEYASDEIFRHDAAGWRRDRLATKPTGRPLRDRPDWACEIVSPSNARRDRIDKLHVLHAAGVPHYWLLDPMEKTLIVHRWTPAGYLIVKTASTGETVRAEPFDAVELRVDVLFGDDDDDE